MAKYRTQTAFALETSATAGGSTPAMDRTEPQIDPRDLAHDDDTSVIAAEQSASRSRVLVPLGTHVQLGSGPEGRLIAATDQLAVIEDADGLQHAERWGHCSVTPAGPEWSTFSSEGVGQSDSLKIARQNQAFSTTATDAPAEGNAGIAEPDPIYKVLARLSAAFDEADHLLNTLAAQPTHDLSDIADQVQQALNAPRVAAMKILTDAIGQAAPQWHSHREGGAS